MDLENKGKILKNKKKLRILITFNIKIEKVTKNYNNMGIIGTVTKMKKKNFGEYKKVYVKDGEMNVSFLIG